MLEISAAENKRDFSIDIGSDTLVMPRRPDTCSSSNAAASVYILACLRLRAHLFIMDPKQTRLSWSKIGTKQPVSATFCVHLFESPLFFNCTVAVITNAASMSTHVRAAMVVSKLLRSPEKNVAHLKLVRLQRLKPSDDVSPFHGCHDGDMSLLQISYRQSCVLPTEPSPVLLDTCSQA